MDPTTLIILILTVLGSGAGGLAVLERRLRRQRVGQRIVEERPHGEQESGARRYLSIFDVFWDLGASDFALELMRQHGLLLQDGGDEDLDRVHYNLGDHIEAHESYNGFLEDSLEAIQEFYEAHRTGGSREMPRLKTRSRKMLPGNRDAGPNGDGDRRALQVTSLADWQDDRDERGRRDRLGTLSDESPEARVRCRRQRLAPELPRRSERHVPGTGEGDEPVDLDEIGKLGPSDLVGGLLEGDFTDRLQAWWEQRRLRSLKSDLDETFERFYDFYVDEVDRDPDFYDMLYGAARRWEREARRIDRLTGSGVLAGHPEEACAELLLEEAVRRAREIAGRTRRNIRETIERIHSHAEEGEFAMAGYLLYLNHHAFFAGRSPGYGDYVRRIDNLAYKVREELRKVG